MGTLAGKTALVTGGSRGIGAAIARRLAEEGADVAITYGASRDKAESLAEALRSGGRRALAIQADAADAGTAERAVAETVAAFGRLDVLVANAGVIAFAPLGAEGGLDAFDKMFSVNVRGVFAVADAAARVMADHGRIIVMGSVNAERIPVSGLAAYGASKAAVAGLVKGWARDVGPRGITVNAIQPGPVDTDMNPKDGPFAPVLKQFLAIPEYAEGRDIAALVAWVAGPEARFVTGAALTLDAGFLA